jgi:hypothetical protein
VVPGHDLDRVVVERHDATVASEQPRDGREERPESRPWLDTPLGPFGRGVRRAAPVVVVIGALCLVLSAVGGIVGFGMGTDCTDNANRGCQVVGQGSVGNVVGQGLVVVLVTLAAGWRPQRSRWAVGLVGAAFAALVFVISMAWAGSYPRA